MDEKIIDFKNSSFIKGLDSSSGKIEIQIGLNYEIKQENNLIFIELNLFIGIDKLYKITDLNRFVNSLVNLKTLYFGKKFILEPTKMYFNLKNKLIIDFLINYKLRNDLKGNKNYNLASDKILLIDSEISEFLDIIYYNSDDINFLNQTYKYKFEKDVDLNINVEKKNLDYFLKIDYSKYGSFMPLDINFKYVFFIKDKIILLTSDDKKSLLKNIYSSNTDKKNNKITFKLNESDLKFFKKDFYDKFSKNNEIKIDNKLKEKIKKFDLVANVYFDMATKGIVSKVEFCYGDLYINPCDDNGRNKDIRDLDREKNIIYEMKNYGMRIVNKLFYLDDNEKIMDLLTSNLKKLKKLAKVYYSEDFKKLHVTDFDKLGLDLGLSEDESLLYMNINLENVSDEELIELLDAIKQKKRYFRLKNGSIINLSNVESERLADFMNHLDIDKSDISNGKFNIPINRCLFIENYLKEKGINNINLDKRLKTLINEMSLDYENDLNISENLLDILRKYQITGVKWLKSLSRYSFGGILADDMGLGKTLQVLTFIDSEKNRNNPCIVIAPTSLVYNWKLETNKFVPNLKVLIITGNKDKRNSLIKLANNYDILITSYGSIRNDLEEYKSIKFLYVFIDEAQHIKNAKTINANSVKKLSAKACYALTGTPVENRISELWSIFDFVMPGYLYDYKNFKKNFEEPVVSDNDLSKLDDLSKLIKPFILRRLKKDVLFELPEKIETNYIVELSDKQKKIYMAYYKKFKKELETLVENEGGNNLEILSLLTRLRQISAHPGCFIDDYIGGSGKLNTVIEIVENSILGGHSVIIFSQFTKILKLIRNELLKNKVNYYYLDGKIPAKERIEIVENFNCDSESVFLVSLKAGGTGLNLTKADIVIHFDPWWNPAVENQASDRAHRIGQKKVVQIYKLIAKGTIEERILNLQDRKKDLVESVIKPGENFLNNMNKEVIMELFELDKN
jgi:SNF2 family DNA or RNA helicase